MWTTNLEMIFSASLVAVYVLTTLTSTHFFEHFVATAIYTIFLEECKCTSPTLFYSSFLIMYRSNNTYNGNYIRKSILAYL